MQRTGLDLAGDPRHVDAPHRLACAQFDTATTGGAIFKEAYDAFIPARLQLASASDASFDKITLDYSPIGDDLTGWWRSGRNRALAPPRSSRRTCATSTGSGVNW